MLIAISALAILTTVTIYSVLHTAGEIHHIEAEDKLPLP